VLNIPLYHHERWAGGGYPFNLAGEQIPKGVRIFSVVDVWDALNTNRPYRKQLSPTAAKNLMIDNMWIHFDPEVISKFFSL
jgi:HD-GYP domain-containing protein (c-di-GMP phosphodiesterase class II)